MTSAMEIALKHLKEALKEVREAHPGPYLDLSESGITVRKLLEIVEDFEDYLAS